MSDRADGDLTDPDAATSGEASGIVTLQRAEWMDRIDRLCAEEGYFEPLGPRHHAYFHDDGPVLLVTFESLERILSRKGQMPFGHNVALANRWSHLTLICEGETWFRDPAVWGYFDRLVDEAFFEDFDRVIFYGGGAGGYAACAYSVCAPGATVLAVSPRATLDPVLAGWDHRNPAARRLDFTTRYGFAPDMTEGAARVFLIYDPYLPENAMHAALFRKPWVTNLPARHFGDAIETAIEMTDLLPDLLRAIFEDRLTPQVFARLLRIRRRFLPYLKGILRKAEMAERPRLALMVCRSVTRRLGGPRFRRRQRELEQLLGLPSQLPPPDGPPERPQPLMIEATAVQPSQS
ncbi:phosphoadenosine phosphosulfate reductase [Tabrizicola sp. TH137]|uniref:phosphoadenosine phosphosulfate reductase n=1 Tax=Tabrizicola sp. TH137 TaxID=2067452 RepID=UPI000C7A48B1|nr:phosphoadenosine phosphosulfate reductase [Tabrizicola sp. TH137]PLL13558.1 phosphoadenosine phosphosulfate reductase [Tabrizicola sp. TH137]